MPFFIAPQLILFKIESLTELATQYSGQAGSELQDTPVCFLALGLKVDTGEYGKDMIYIHFTHI